MTSCKLVIHAFATLALSFCLQAVSNADVSEASHIKNGSEVFPQTDPNRILIYLSKPSFAYKIIGQIEARGMAEQERLNPLDIFGAIDQALSPQKRLTEKEDIALAMKALKEEAASIGATGIIISSSVQSAVTSNATERRIIGVAIRGMDATQIETPATVSSERPRTETDNSCVVSSQCYEAHFCRQGACLYIPPWTRRSTKLPENRKSLAGDFCLADENCDSGLQCSKSGICGK